MKLLRDVHARCVPVPEGTDSDLLKRFGTVMFDVRPEELIDHMASDVGKGTIEKHLSVMEGPK